MTETVLFIIFAIVVVTFLVFDLGVFNKKAHRISPREALWQSLFWVAVSLVFAGLIFIFDNTQSATEFLTAYVTEKMLSVDNLFVILLIFNFFKLEEKYHHKVLFWGILGAIVMRAIFIYVGDYVVEQFHWILYIFGAVLMYTGFKLLNDKKEEHVDLERSKVLRLAHKYLPISTQHHNGKFTTRENGKFMFTSLFLVVLMVETTDLIFAIDSIPAAFAISQNAFVIYTANIFAVLGLRAMFFLLESILHKFHHLQKGLAFILLFIGGKMIAEMFHFKVEPLASFAVIMLALFLSMVLSVAYPKKF